MGFLAIFFFRWAVGWPAASTPNLEDQVIFDQVFLPLALDTPVSNCKAAVLVLVRPGYFISPVLAISGEAPDGRLATPHGRTEEIRGQMGEKGLTEEDWNDRINWRKRII